MMSSPLIWSAELLQTLVNRGVSHAVISPGSRSAPVTMAAALHPALQTHVYLDERSAAFTALGIGKATGRPALLICTSGTATANYFPAVIEARQSGVPMILLTADRPPHLRGTGSSQTIDQIKLYGDYAIFFHETGEPQTGRPDLKRLREAGKQAVRKSIFFGGPAHINLPFRKPLEPSAGDIKTVLNEIYTNGTSKSLTSQQQHDLTEAVSSATGAESESAALCFGQAMHLAPPVRSLLSSSKRPLIVAGPAMPHHCPVGFLQNLKTALNAPVIAEPGSSVGKETGTLLRYEQFLRNAVTREELRPDLIIRFGDQPFTRSLLDAFELWDRTPVIHFQSRISDQDQVLSITQHQQIHPAGQADLTFLVQPADEKWLDKWKGYETESEKQLAAALSAQSGFTDGHVFHHLDTVFPTFWNRMISNSFPVRDTALFGKTTGRQFVNRGAAGIDGIISTGLGIHFASENPTLAVTGDLAFLHDSNALLSVKESANPFVIIVINNGGGTIFRMLPLNRAGAPLAGSDTFRRFFETPQHADIGKLAAAHQIPFLKITKTTELQCLHPDQLTGNLIVECVTDADASMALRNRLWGT